MRAHAGCNLQHGAILIDWDGRLQAGSMGLADDSTLRPHITTIVAEGGRGVSRKEIESAVVAAVSGILGVRLTHGTISPAETARETDLGPEFRIQTKGDPDP
jgi:hypothetical protein